MGREPCLPCWRPAPVAGPQWSLWTLEVGRGLVSVWERGLRDPHSHCPHVRDTNVGAAGGGRGDRTRGRGQHCRQPQGEDGEDVMKGFRARVLEGRTSGKFSWGEGGAGAPPPLILEGGRGSGRACSS